MRVVLMCHNLQSDTTVMIIPPTYKSMTKEILPFHQNTVLIDSNVFKYHVLTVIIIHDLKITLISLFSSPLLTNYYISALKNLTISVEPGTAVPVGSTVKFKATTDSYIDDVFFLWFTDDSKSSSGHGAKGIHYSRKFNE